MATKHRGRTTEKDRDPETVGLALQVASDVLNEVAGELEVIGRQYGR